MTWRETAYPIVGKVIADNADKSEKEIRKALREAYPWFPRSNYPYKAWCDEVNSQLNAHFGRSRKKIRGVIIDEPRLF